MMALFRSLGSKHRRSLPLRLHTYTMLLTQSVGSSTFWIIPCYIISSSSAFTLSLIWMRHFLGAWTIGWLFGRSTMLYSPVKLPIRSNWSGYASIRSFVELIGVLSDGVTGVFVSWLTGAHFVLWMEQCRVTSLKSWREGYPSIVVTLEVTM